MRSMSGREVGRRRVVALVAVACVAAVAPASEGSAQSGGERELVGRARHLRPDYDAQRMLPFAPNTQREAATAQLAAPRVGAERRWFALDAALNQLYLKDFTLRGKGRHVEVWVASDSDATSRNLRFPSGDCRNDERVRIGDRRVRYLIRQFGNNILPKESRVFSRPPRRNGSHATAPRFFNIPRGYFRGEGDNTVVLIDNVREENFYDTDNSQNLSYIAGFFSSDLNELTDRNIMTIDGFDWIHRTRAHPPHEPVPGNVCESSPARPFLYEGVFAHEYQHLLHYYQDPNERIWVDEGLSMWAEHLTGYSAPERPITSRRFESTTQCFLGNLGIPSGANPNPRVGGPENSLTEWQDQGGDEILCDYGAANTFMQMLADDHGRPFMRSLHRRNANGLTGVQRVLNDLVNRRRVLAVIHEWAAMVALDGVLDDGAELHRVPAPSARVVNRYRSRGLDATINWDTEHTHSTAGAPPNGSDYVRLRNASDAYLPAGAIESISFDGSPNRSYTVQLIAYDDTHDNAWIKRLRLNADSDGTLGGAKLVAAIGTTAQTVAAIVTFDDRRESRRSYARYTLEVDGVQQRGG
jgi:hypothetical protein